MATDANGWSRGRGSRWTLIPWGGAACLLLLPFVAMRFTSEVNWSSGDFILMGAMLGLACALVETVVRLSGSWAYRLAACAAIGSAFLIIWANLAVGIVGSENNPANQSFFAALGVGSVGALLARFRAKGMALAMATTGGAIGIAFILAVSSATDEPNVSHWRELIATLVITSPFLLSAWLFRRAAQGPPTTVKA